MLGIHRFVGPGRTLGNNIVAKPLRKSCFPRLVVHPQKILESSLGNQNWIKLALPIFKGPCPQPKNKTNAFASSSSESMGKINANDFGDSLSSCNAFAIHLQKTLSQHVSQFPRN